MQMMGRREEKAGMESEVGKKQDGMDGWKSSSCEVGVDRTGRGWRIDLREPKVKLPYLNKVRNPELRTWLLGSCTGQPARRARPGAKLGSVGRKV